MFFAAVFAFRLVTQSFFPPATRPQFLVDTYLPAGTHIRESEAFADTVQRFIQAQPGVTHVSSFIGAGGLRFLLVYTPEGENRAYVEFLVNVDDERKIDGLQAAVQKYLDENHPNANAIVKKFLLGPGEGGRIQARVSGANPDRLRALADEAIKVIRDDGGAVCVRHDWRGREKEVRPPPLEQPPPPHRITPLEEATTF